LHGEIYLSFHNSSFALRYFLCNWQGHSVSDTPLVYVAQLVDFAKFQAEKYDFDLYKGFFFGKNGPNSPDFKETKSKLLGFYDRFH